MTFNPYSTVIMVPGKQSSHQILHLITAQLNTIDQFLPARTNKLYRSQVTSSYGYSYYYKGLKEYYYKGL
jgi:hypothetical protein